MFSQNISQKVYVKVSHKHHEQSSSFDGVCRFKTLLIYIISSKWLDTGIG